MISWLRRMDVCGIAHRERDRLPPCSSPSSTELSLSALLVPASALLLGGY